LGERFKVARGGEKRSGGSPKKRLSPLPYKTNHKGRQRKKRQEGEHNKKRRKEILLLQANIKKGGEEGPEKSTQCNWEQNPVDLYKNTTTDGGDSNHWGGTGKGGVRSNGKRWGKRGKQPGGIGFRQHKERFHTQEGYWVQGAEGVWEKGLDQKKFDSSFVGIKWKGGGGGETKVGGGGFL